MKNNNNHPKNLIDLFEEFLDYLAGNDYRGGANIHTVEILAQILKTEIQDFVDRGQHHFRTLKEIQEIGHETMRNLWKNR